MSKVQVIKPMLSGEMGGKVEVMEITPDGAQTFVERGGRNRRIRASKLRDYTADMATDNWRLTGDTIKIATHGQVLDGWHRLQSCIDSGVPFTTVVVYDVDPKLFTYMDGGAGRSTADHLHIMEVTNDVVIAGALGWVIRFDRGGLGYGGSSSGTTTTSRANRGYTHPSKRKVAEFYKSTNEAQWQRAAQASSRCSSLGPKTVFCACHFLFQRKSNAAADRFFDAIAKGDNLLRDDPRFRLRNQLIKNRLAREKMSTGFMVAMIFKAWNLDMTGTSVRSLSVKRSEKFPVPLGIPVHDITTD